MLLDDAEACRMLDTR